MLLREDLREVVVAVERQVELRVALGLLDEGCVNVGLGRDLIVAEVVEVRLGHLEHDLVEALDVRLGLFSFTKIILPMTTVASII